MIRVADQGHLRKVPKDMARPPAYSNRKSNQVPQYVPQTQLQQQGYSQQGPARYPVLVTPFNHSSIGSAPGLPVTVSSFPMNMQTMIDPDQIKELKFPCMVQCPHCRYTGLTMIIRKPNICLLILGFFLIPLFFIGLPIMWLALERTHICTRCFGEIARKKACC